MKVRGDGWRTTLSGRLAVASDEWLAARPRQLPVGTIGVIQSMRKIGMATAGIALGCGCLWLSARNVNLAEAARIFAAADLAAVFTGVALYGAAMIIRAVRWQAILEFRVPVGGNLSLQALLAGYAVNSALPARLGELFRADYLARRSGLSRSSVLGSIFIERLLDLVVVVGALALGLTLAGGGDMASRDILLGGGIVVALGVGLLVLIATRLTDRNAEALLSRLVTWLPVSAGLARRLGAMVGDFAELLRIVRTTRFLAVAAVTVPIWALEIGAIWWICDAVGVGLTLAGALSLMGGASLSTLMPTAPGYVGSYQFAYVVILAQFGIAATAAVVAATTVQIYLIGGFTLLGFGTWAVTALVEARRVGGTVAEARS